MSSRIQTPLVKVVAIIILNVVADYVILTQTGGNLTYLAITNFVVFATGIGIGFVILNSQMSINLLKIVNASFEVAKEYYAIIRKEK